MSTRPAPSPAVPATERRAARRTTLGVRSPVSRLRRLTRQTSGPAGGPALPPVAVLRWVAVAVGLIVAATQVTATSYALFVGGAILVAYAAWRTVRPVPYDESRSTTISLWLDALVHTELVLLTGAWASPYTFALLPNAVQAGFARGPRDAFKVGIAMVVLVSVPYIAVTQDLVVGIRNSVLWMAVLLVVALTSGFARQLTTESERERDEAQRRLEQLSEANALLASLHQMAQTLPASLDLDELFESASQRLRELVPNDAIALYLREDADGSWRPQASAGTRAEPAGSDAALPRPVRKAAGATKPFLVAELRSALGPGVDPASRSGIYAPLFVQGRLVGVLAVESRAPGEFTARDVELVARFAEPLAVSVDNAQWFARLHALGAAEERKRLARDLHDQIGQSLTGLSYGLDLARTVAERGDDVEPLLDELRTELRRTIREVRDALYDLRTDVSEDQPLQQTLQHHLDRVRTRSHLGVSYHHQVAGRLPLPQERELWWIAREAITNVERHARAAHLTVRYRADSRGAVLVIADDGCGFDRSTAPADHYGMLGMRERAGAIGALLDIDTTPGTGTTVRITVPAAQGVPA